MFIKIILKRVAFLMIFLKKYTESIELKLKYLIFETMWVYEIITKT